MLGLLLVFNNGILIEWYAGGHYTYEDSYVNITFPLSFSHFVPSIQLTTDYTAVFTGNTLPPITWCGNCTKTGCSVYGNSSVLAAGTKIYFRAVFIGY